MTDDNSNKPVDIGNSLEEFEGLFFGKAEEPTEEAAAENEEDSLATEETENEDTPVAEDEDEAPEEADESEDEDEEEEEPEEDERPKGKKNRKSFQERINELTAKAREAERREAQLLRRLEELETRSQKEESTNEEKAPVLRDQLPDDAPNPDAKGEDGEPLYPLGEFDPTFIRDLTRYTIEVERKAAEERAAQEAQARQLAEEQQKLQNAWIDRVAEVEKELPDLREKISDLTDTFQDIEPMYGEYLATTIMASELGPQIMYYLSQNIGEAQKIVASGPAAATLALGRLEAKLAKTVEVPKETKRNKLVSDAPPPPDARTRGAHGRFAVAPDTSDLEAFEREFFKR